MVIIKCVYRCLIMNLYEEIYVVVICVVIFIY